MAIDLNKIKYFRAVATTLNISKASKLVNLSQPALSLQMQNLEHEIGASLFTRSNRGLILTEAGHTFLARSHMLQNWERDTLDELGEALSPSGELKIGTYTTASSYLLAPKLKAFLKQYPDLSITYDYSDTDTIIEKIKTLELDMAVISEVPDDPGIESLPFYKNELVLAAAASSKVSKSIGAKELALWPKLSYPLKLDYCYREVERKLGKHLRVAPTVIESVSFDTLKQSLLHDLGLCFMPLYLIEEELKSKKLKRVEVQGLKLPITFSLVFKRGHRLSRRVQVFKDYLCSITMINNV